MNVIKQVGVTFEQACETAKLLSKQNPCCSIHVNAVVAKDGYDRFTKNASFNVYFCTSDWYSSDSTVASYVDGENHA